MTVSPSLSKDDDENARPPRRLLALEGSEVSLVDRPAIRRKFLVVKQKDGVMGIFEAEEDDVVETQVDDTSVKDATDQESLDYVAKMFEDNADWTWLEVSKADEGSNLPDSFAETLATAVPALRKTISQLEGEELKASKGALAFLSKAATGKFPFPSFLNPENKETKTTKNEDGMTENKTEDKNSLPAVQISPDGTIQINGEPIAKAKQFTAERIEALKATLGNIAGLLMETGGVEAVKAALAQGLPASDLPEDAMLDSMVRPVETPGVKKAEDATDLKSVEPSEEGKSNLEDFGTVVTKALEPLTSKMKDMGNRIEAIEKAREPSKADMSDEVADSNTVKKSEGDMWGNVL
jgi:hypothetical protein